MKDDEYRSMQLVRLRYKNPDLFDKMREAYLEAYRRQFSAKGLSMAEVPDDKKRVILRKWEDVAQNPNLSVRQVWAMIARIKEEADLESRSGQMDLEFNACVRNRIVRLASVIKQAQDYDLDFNKELKQSYTPYGNNLYYKDPFLSQVLGLVMQTATGGSTAALAGGSVMESGQAVGLGIEVGSGASTGGVARVQTAQTDDGNHVTMRIIELNPSGSLMPQIYQRVASEFPNLDENNRRTLSYAYVLVHELAHHTLGGQLAAEGEAENRAEQFLNEAKNIFVQNVVN